MWNITAPPAVPIRDAHGPAPTARKASPRMRTAIRALLALSALLGSCSSPGSDPATGWPGTMDTLASGEILVRNTGDPLWAPDREWRVEEELRIGSAASVGPDLFGEIRSFDVDASGRVFVLDGSAQEIRVFDREGVFLRTVGGRGEGPREFTLALSVDLSPGGEIWVLGLGNGRVSMFDTLGTWLRSEPSATRAIILPYPGGFDPAGHYNIATWLPDGEATATAMKRFDESFVPIDTVWIPRDPVERRSFTIFNEQGTPTMTVAVPFQGSMSWRFSPAGTLWTLLTGRYELAEATTGGRVLRRVTMDHEPLRVTGADREQALQSLEQIGGVPLDWSDIPRGAPGSRPAVVSFVLDDEGHVWVERAAAAGEEGGRSFDIFDPVGRYLGMLRLPFPLPLASSPEPIIRDGVLHGVTTDESGVPYVVRARIVKPR